MLYGLDANQIGWKCLNKTFRLHADIHFFLFVRWVELKRGVSGVKSLLWTNILNSVINNASFFLLTVFRKHNFEGDTNIDADVLT
jgi:hypothetical protein